jgi:hypothetical protein
MAGGEEGFAEVAGDDFFTVANGGEVDAGIPAAQYIDVRRYMLELGGGEDSRVFPIVYCFEMTGVCELVLCNTGIILYYNRCNEERFQQLCDAGRVHSIRFTMMGATCSSEFRKTIVAGPQEIRGR